MKPLRSVVCAICALAAAAPPVSAASYLYAPRPVEEAVPAPSREEGILVKEITIKRGDTLSAISRVYSGHASYFPQILLFNRISNPDLIYEGKTLRVPITATAKAAQVSEGAKEEVVEGTKGAEASSPAKKSKAKKRKKGAKTAPVAVKTAPAPPAAAPEGRETGEQLLYQQGVAAYRRNACSEALPLFEKFMGKYPRSPLAPDIALLRADCHLRESGQ